MGEPQTRLGWRERSVDVCALPLVQRLAALLDQDPARFRTGDDLPQGWQMILFAPTARQSALGPDGHPLASAAIAPADLPRRMLGGRRLRFDAPLRIGAELHRVSEITAWEEKRGRSGRLAIATLRHSIHEPDLTPAVIEEQDVIYRAAAADTAPDTAPDAAAEPASAPPPDPPRPTPTLTRTLTPDPVLLFRYSAITFNGHRIHYDLDYATAAEGYPGLIVNGGLTALLLLELLKPALTRPLTALQVRNRRPLICGRPLRLCATPTAATGWTLWAEDDVGRLALEATAQ